MTLQLNFSGPREAFWGTVTLRVQAGDVVKVDVERTFRGPDLKAPPGEHPETIQIPMN